MSRTNFKQIFLNRFNIENILQHCNFSKWSSHVDSFFIENFTTNVDEVQNVIVIITIPIHIIVNASFWGRNTVIISVVSYWLENYLVPLNGRVFFVLLVVVTEEISSEFVIIPARMHHPVCISYCFTQEIVMTQSKVTTWYLYVVVICRVTRDISIHIGFQK